MLENMADSQFWNRRTRNRRAAMLTTSANPKAGLRPGRKYRFRPERALSFAVEPAHRAPKRRGSGVGHGREIQRTTARGADLRRRAAEARAVGHAAVGS